MLLDLPILIFIEFWVDDCVIISFMLYYLSYFYIRIGNKNYKMYGAI
jgi:hypothetical protein